MLAAFIDQSLETALLTKFVLLEADDQYEVFRSEAATLRDFYAKIQIAYASGIIGKSACSDLNLIRKIRNTFAHSHIDLSFDTPEIADACKFLLLLKRDEDRNAREIYINTAFEYAFRLITVRGQDRERAEPTMRQADGRLD